MKKTALNYSFNKTRGTFHANYYVFIMSTVPTLYGPYLLLIIRLKIFSILIIAAFTLSLNLGTVETAFLGLIGWISWAHKWSPLIGGKYKSCDVCLAKSGICSPRIGYLI